MNTITLLLAIFSCYCLAISYAKQRNGHYNSRPTKTNFASIQKLVNEAKGKRDSVACGVPAIQPIVDARRANGDRIVNGIPARPGSWPYVVSLRYQGMHFCGGAVISNQWIATASHCVEDRTDPSDWMVNLGRYTQDGDDPSLVVSSVEQIFVNPDYDSTTVSNDITLMKLSSSITYNDRIRPICLPTSEPEPGTPCIVSGWGDTQGTGSSDVLNQVTVPIISRDICNDDDHYAGGVLDSMICAGYEQGGKDACQGDSGGPLMCNYDGAWHLSGITSWGEGCATPHRPGVYTNVFNYVDWIQETVNNN